MTYQNFTKAQRHEIRRLCGVAYERDLAAAVSKLEADFHKWRQGGFDVFELVDKIHRFHQGPARKLYSIYVDGDPFWTAAIALDRGLLTQAEIAPDMLEPMLKLAALFRNEPR